MVEGKNAIRVERLHALEKVVAGEEMKCAPRVGKSSVEEKERSASPERGGVGSPRRDSFRRDCGAIDALPALGQALLAAVRQTSVTPAAALGLGPVGLVGGGLADLVVLDADLAVQGVLARGTWVDLPGSSTR